MRNIDKIFDDMKEGDIVEVGLSTATIHLGLGSGMAYQIFRNDKGIQFPKAEVVAKKTKIGYDINRVFYKPYDTLSFILSAKSNPQFVDFISTKFGKVEYPFFGFSFTKDNASRKAHAYALKIAKEVSEKHGLRLVDKSQEEIAEWKRELERQVNEYIKEQEQEDRIK